MAESMESLYRRGAISSKQMGRMAKPAILKKTKSGVPTKMAAFDSRADTKGGITARGEVPVRREINHPTNQRAGSSANASGMPSKGGRVNKGGQPTVRAIDEVQNPKFPAGGTVKRNAKPVGRTGLGGSSRGLRSSGGEYGGPNSRANG